MGYWLSRSVMLRRRAKHSDFDLIDSTVAAAQDRLEKAEGLSAAILGSNWRNGNIIFGLEGRRKKARSPRRRSLTCSMVGVVPSFGHEALGVTSIVGPSRHDGRALEYDLWTRRICRYGFTKPIVGNAQKWMEQIVGSTDGPQAQVMSIS